MLHERHSRKDTEATNTTMVLRDRKRVCARQYPESAMAGIPYERRETRCVQSAAVVTDKQRAGTASGKKALDATAALAK